LGAGDINAKLNKAEEERRSPSCDSNDKCYCSMGETVDDATTWCDSDSCASASKCYCTLHDRKSRKKKSANANEATRKNKSIRSRKADKLALDYELFTVGGSGRHSVKPTEALSVKKSVEMAAVFADVKLSQTTDITSLQPSKDNKPHKSKHHHKKHNASDKSNGKNNNILNPKSEDYYRVSDVILRKESEKESNNKRAPKTDGYYQPIVAQRPVSASIEDSLGYLP
jgi:hypothetical protein